MSVFWDASALAHVCVPGQITRTARELVRADVIAIWWGTPLEVRSVLNRAHREAARFPARPIGLLGNELRSCCRAAS